MNDEFSISNNLCLKISNSSYKLVVGEKKGLAALFEMQKAQNNESCDEHIRSYIRYLLHHKATFLALFTMKNFSKIFNVEAVDIAISNAISINSKVCKTKNRYFIYV